jgi:hypothetical protein
VRRKFIYTQEPILSSKTRKNQLKSAQDTGQPVEDVKISDLKQSWISMRSGVRIITVISVALGLFTSYSLQAEAWSQRLLFGLIIGGSIWLVFFLVLYVNRLIGRKPKQ